MEHIIIKHISGSKAGQVNQFSIKDFKELSFGRDPSSTLKYDPDKDDLVSTRHAKIEPDAQDPAQFILTDLNSRNGTYVNNQKINGAVKINPGDKVRFGPNGPEFVFDLDPRPIAQTRLAQSISNAVSSRAERIVITHISGSKAKQIDYFPLSGNKELSLGRDPSSTIKYDPDRDDLVSTRHAKIEPDAQDPAQFILTDLNSRNGTYVNNQKINGAVKINPGDKVRFGPNGPEFVFDLDPRPVPATRIGDALVPMTRVSGGNALAPPTRMAGDAMALASTENTAPAPAGSVGKATVMRMVNEAKTETRNTMLIVGSAILFIIVAAAGVLGYRSYQLGKQQQSLAGMLEEQKQLETGHQEDLNKWKEEVLSEQKRLDESVKAAEKKIDAVSPLSPDLIESVSKSVVYIEVSWKLINADTGAQMYHRVFINVARDSRGRETPKIKGAPAKMPIFIAFRDGTVEPLLTSDPGPLPIGQSASGSGFIVNGDGFALTNNHVAAGWKSRYDLLPIPSIVFSEDGKLLGVGQGPPKQALSWVPSQSKQGRFDGRNDVLNITFPKSTQRFSAKLVGSSDQHDVALIKVETPNKLEKLEINDNYDSVKVGEPITVLGYPGVSPTAVAVVGSSNPFNAGNKYLTAPDVTVTSGSIGKIIRLGKTQDSSAEVVFTGIGDSYQLTVNATGAGNSGGPAVDNKGRVVGVFYAGRDVGGARVSFAVPIRYAVQLLGPAGSNQDAKN